MRSKHVATDLGGQDFYTVQNLSRVGEAWSFTRPLDDGSVLPMAAHLGDVTLRNYRTSNQGGTYWKTYHRSPTSGPLCDGCFFGNGLLAPGGDALVEVGAGRLGHLAA